MQNNMLKFCSELVDVVEVLSNFTDDKKALQIVHRKLS
jgi:hypothetical protein